MQLKSEKKPTLDQKSLQPEPTEAGKDQSHVVAPISLLGALLLAAFAVYQLNPKSPPVTRVEPAVESRAAAAPANGALKPLSPVALPPPQWIAAAPGRVEPKSGEIKLASAVLGRIAEVLVKINDRVEEGDILVRLDDDEIRARIFAADAEVGARKRERDAGTLISGRDEVRRVGDLVASHERTVVDARLDLDTAVAARRAGTGSDALVADARSKLADARDKLRLERDALRSAQSKSGLVNPNRLESALSAARADWSAADALHEKTRIRAPISGTVLQLQAKAGETVAPSPDQQLVVIGDVSVIRVKAEVEERDIGRVTVGQKAFVRADGFPGRDFEGIVSAISPALGAPRIGQRGPRRATDVDVLDVTIDMDGPVQLLPGMRVDAFFRP